MAAKIEAETAASALYAAWLLVTGAVSTPDWLTPEAQIARAREAYAALGRALDALGGAL